MTAMSGDRTLTRHAEIRCRTRRITRAIVEMALMYGRYRCERAAEIYVIGWREIRFWAERGLDLSRFDGVEVVCSHAGRVITVYRNRKPASIRDRALRAAA